MAVSASRGRPVKKALPPGYAVAERWDGKWMGWDLGTGKAGPIVARRIVAVNWCWLQVAERSVAP